MTRINTNVSSLRGLRAQERANNLLDQSLTRLSTGVKINTGADNPAGLIASEQLGSQISAIEQSISNSNRANNVIATADAALGEIGGLLQQVRGLVQEGLNDGALSQAEIEANQLQIDTALNAINRISSNTTFAGDRLIDGSLAFTTSVSTADAAKLSDFQINEAILGSTGQQTISATVSTVAEQAELRYDGGDLTAATTLEVGGSDGTEVIFLGASATKSDIVSAVNGISDSTGVTASILSGAGVNTQDDVLTGTQGTTAATLAVGGANGFTLTADADGTGGNDISFEIVDTGAGGATVSVTGNAITLDLGGNAALTGTLTAAAINGNADAAALVTAAAAGTGGTNSAVTASANLAGGADSTFTFTDIRTGGITNDLSVNFASSGVANSTVAFSFDDATGVLDVTVGTTATLQNVSDAFQTDATARGVVQASVAGGTLGDTFNVGLTTTTAQGNAGALSINDVRTDTTNALTVAFNDGQAANSTLTVTTAGNAITVNLAKDANGYITSTLTEIATALSTSTAALTNGGTVRDSVELIVDGDGTNRAGELATTTLNTTNGNTIAFESVNFGSDEEVRVNVLNGTFNTSQRQEDGSLAAASRDNGVDIGVTINGQAVDTNGLDATLRTTTLDATLSFVAASNVVNETVSITIDGGGALFQIGQEVSAAGQIGLGIDAVNTARLGGISGKLFELGSGGGKSLLDVGEGGVTGTQLVDIINESLDRVSTLRGRLGAVQANVIETNISTLGVALENISEARSQILDTDFAVETAALTKSQILSQASISVLSIANQNPQQVLALLG
ncbi:MAG: flagellin [Planctomycetota bacterium]